MRNDENMKQMFFYGTQCSYMHQFVVLYFNKFNSGSGTDDDIVVRSVWCGENDRQVMTSGPAH